MLRCLCAALVLAACGGGGDDFRDASANLEAQMGSPVTGYAYFAEVPRGTQVDVSLNNCAVGESYPVYILDGAPCIGSHWDTARGEGIPDVVCNDLGLHSSYVRAPNDASTRWTIGDDSATDVKVHALASTMRTTLQSRSRAA
jgi:hypothetical protein